MKSTKKKGTKKIEEGKREENKENYEDNVGSLSLTSSKMVMIQVWLNLNLVNYKSNYLINYLANIY